MLKIPFIILGIKIIQDSDVLKDFNEIEQENILLAIKYHNKLSIPSIENSTTEMYVKLVRDADKLDIFKVVTDYYADIKYNKDKIIELELPDKPAVSKKIYESLMKEKSAEYKYLKTLADFKLLQMAWVFDINYRKSYKIIEADLLHENNFVRHSYDKVAKVVADIVERKK